MFEGLTIWQQISVWALPVLLAITMREAAHAWMALKCGDMAVYQQGRVSINPIVHIDPFGTILVPLLFVLLGSNFFFGWAKPTPIDFDRLSRRDGIRIVMAGTLASLLMAISWSLLINLKVLGTGGLEFLVYAGLAGLLVNSMLLVFNLLPILPLGGGRIVCALLPLRMALKYEKLEPYGLFILMALIIVGVIQWFVLPLVNANMHIIFWLTVFT